MSHTTCVFIREFKNTLFNIIININICQLFMQFLSRLIDILHAVLHFYPGQSIFCTQCRISTQPHTTGTRVTKLFMLKLHKLTLSFDRNRRNMQKSACCCSQYFLKIMNGKVKFGEFQPPL